MRLENLLSSVHFGCDPKLSQKVKNTMFLVSFCCSYPPSPVEDEVHVR